MRAQSGQRIVIACIERYQILSFAWTYIRWSLGVFLGFSWREIKNTCFERGGFRSFQCWLLQCAYYSFESLTASRLFSFHDCYFLIIRNSSFIFQFTVNDCNSVCLSVWFSCLYSVQCSVCFLSLENWACDYSLMWFLTVSYVQWFLTESFFGYFESDNCFSQSSVCKCNCFSESQCWLCSSVVGGVSLSSVSVWIPLTITFNLIMIPIVLLCAKTFACLLVLFIQSEWFLISMQSEEAENLA